MSDAALAKSREVCKDLISFSSIATTEREILSKSIVNPTRSVTTQPPLILLHTCYSQIIPYFLPTLESSHLSCQISKDVLRRSNPHDHRVKRRYNYSLRYLMSSMNFFYQHTLGTDSSQGKGQVISNINACLAVQATIRSTLGPYGGDLLLVDENGRQTITNDGATVMKVYKNL